MNATHFHPGLFDSEGSGGQARLIASRCRSCGRHAFPSKRFCSFCHAGDMQPVRLGGRGRIYSFTHVSLPPKSMGRPYVAAYVDMDESVRIFGQIADVDVSELRIGDSVHVDFRPIGTDLQGQPVMGYVFVAHKESSQ